MAKPKRTAFSLQINSMFDYDSYELSQWYISFGQSNRFNVRETLSFELKGLYVPGMKKTIFFKKKLSDSF